MTKEQTTILTAIAEHHKKMTEAGELWTTWAAKPKNPSAKTANEFFLGVLFDQQQSADRAWAAGKHMAKEQFAGGHFWRVVSRTPIEEVEQILRYGYEGSAYFRFWRKFSVYLKDNADLILSRYDGDVRNIWQVSPNQVNCIYDRFIEFRGIGDALAKMAQFILVRDWGMAGGSKAKRHMRAKPDVHLRRVTHRLGLITRPSPCAAANEIDQLGIKSQADFDLVVFRVGQSYCHKSSPNCEECPLADVCTHAAR